MIRDYAAAVRYLRQHPEEVPQANARPFTHPAGCLFWCLSPDGHFHVLPGPRYVGCALCITAGTHVSWSIQAHTRVLRMGLPRKPEQLTGKHLVDLWNLQEHLDETLRDLHWRDANRMRLIAPWPWDRVEDQDWSNEENIDGDD